MAMAWRKLDETTPGWYEGFMACQAWCNFWAAKPSQFFYADETGVTIVHKRSKVIDYIGRHNVLSSTLTDKEKKCLQFLLVLLLRVAKYTPFFYSVS